ncbi:MAG: hypothetical protein H7249_17425 [Chitinophagaceae bacterium]|nr:hypothetical protein [Oligoflexus sp.]
MKIYVVLASVLLFSPVIAQAQTDDPVDKNVGGPYVGGQFVVGQGVKVGDSSPGVAYLIGADVGYVVKRDTWNRIELGLELSTGKASYKDKDFKEDVDLNLNLVTMVKAGYGYSLGGHSFGVFRAGVGIAQASYDGKSDLGPKVNGGSSTGVATLLAWDAVIPASDALDFTFGVSWRTVNFNFKDLPNNQGSYQLNIPAVYAGARVKL